MIGGNRTGQKSGSYDVGMRMLRVGFEHHSTMRKCYVYRCCGDFYLYNAAILHLATVHHLGTAIAITHERNLYDKAKKRTGVDIQRDDLPSLLFSTPEVDVGQWPTLVTTIMDEIARQVRMGILSFPTVTRTQYELPPRTTEQSKPTMTHRKRRAARPEWMATGYICAGCAQATAMTSHANQLLQRGDEPYCSRECARATRPVVDRVITCTWCKERKEVTYETARRAKLGQEVCCTTLCANQRKAALGLGKRRTGRNQHTKAGASA